MTQEPEHCPPVEEEKLSAADSFKLDLYYWLQALVVPLIVLTLLFSFVGRVIGVEGPSMLPTLHDGDMLVLRTFFYTPAAGDVVVLTKQSFSDRAIVKRVIATEGQTVHVDYAAGTVTVDGAVLDEPYINEPMVERPGSTMNQVIVPAGHIFVLGDNRNHSSDSRYPPIGLVDVRCVLGQAVFIAFPFRDFGPVR